MRNNKIKPLVRFLVFIMLLSFGSAQAFSQKKKPKSKTKKSVVRMMIDDSPKPADEKEIWFEHQSEDGKVFFKFPVKKPEFSEKSIRTTGDGKKIDLFQYGAIKNGIIYLVNYYQGICEGLDKETKSLEVTKFALNYVQANETIISDKYLEFKQNDVELIGKEITSREADGSVKQFKVLADDKNFYLLVANYAENKDKNYANKQIDKFLQSFSIAKVN